MHWSEGGRGDALSHPEWLVRISIYNSSCGATVLPDLLHSRQASMAVPTLEPHCLWICCAKTIVGLGSRRPTIHCILSRTLAWWKRTGAILNFPGCAEKISRRLRYIQHALLLCGWYGLVSAECFCTWVVCAWHIYKLSILRSGITVTMTNISSRTE